MDLNQCPKYNSFLHFLAQMKAFPRGDRGEELSHILELLVPFPALYHKRHFLKIFLNICGYPMRFMDLKNVLLKGIEFLNFCDLQEIHNLSTGMTSPTNLTNNHS